MRIIYIRSESWNHNCEMKMEMFFEDESEIRASSVEQWMNGKKWKKEKKWYLRFEAYLSRHNYAFHVADCRPLLHCTHPISMLRNSFCHAARQICVSKNYTPRRGCDKSIHETNGRIPFLKKKKKNKIESAKRIERKEMKFDMRANGSHHHHLKGFSCYFAYSRDATFSRFVSIWLFMIMIFEMVFGGRVLSHLWMRMFGDSIWGD